jgi:MerR family transcriptional regulator, redox-sensitive transcriptional activator SoxR
VSISATSPGDWCVRPPDDTSTEPPEPRTPTKSDWSRLSRDWRPRLDAQIERLERLRAKLDGCIGCGCLSLRTCSLNNPDDEVAPRGPGAVYLEPGA